jgi:6-phosphogluconolactonase
VTVQSPDLTIVDDPTAVLATMLAEQARRGGSIVLTGGSGVGAAYERAAAEEPDWSKVTLWWGDERCVPPEDERSNFRLGKETLLDHLERQPDEVHRMRGELQPSDGAGEYDKALADVELDFLLLGLGPDGHCASLFPGSAQLDIEDVRVTSGTAGLEPLVDRITMTMPTLQSARRIVFIASGANKADAVARAFGGEITRDVPASLLRLAPVRVEVLLDAAAATGLGGADSAPGAPR